MKKSLSLSFVIALLLTSCGGDSGTNSGGGNTTGPQVVSTFPANGATGVAVSAAIQATFSRDMDPSTITNTSFTVNNGVTGVVAYSSRVATLTPSTVLSNSTLYTATVSTAVKDEAGEAVAQTHSWSFTTAAASTNTVTDIDGNVYQTVTIGTQVWMKENLRVTHYRNGDPVPRVSDQTQWANTFTGAYCEYNNSVPDAITYGRLYNWSAVNDSRNIAPLGWHVATDQDWKTLEVFLGMSYSDADMTGGNRGTDQGGKLKETGTAHWVSPNAGATNASGFTALPAGFRNSSGSFSSLNYSGSFWTATLDANENPISRRVSYNSTQVSRLADIAFVGYSVRCVKN